MTAADAMLHAWPPVWARDLLPAAADLDPAARYLAIEAGSWPNLERAERRALALVVLASLDSRGGGATRLDLATVGDRLARLGVADDDRAAACRLADGRLSWPALASFVGQPGDYRPFIVDGRFLYHERDLRLEQRLADALRDRLARPEAATPAAVTETRWTKEQRAAIEATCRRSLTVISGGPGTGKTALIGGIVRAWMAAGLERDRIAIAAPTGKAANRIAQLLASERADDAPVPATLHRLLGLAGG